MQPKAVDGNSSIDLIRVVAITVVVLFHAAEFPFNTPEKVTLAAITNWWTIGAIGLMGVPLFVMLSGALLLTPEKANEPVRVFFKKRFNRIGLPMIFWSIFYFGWAISVDQEVLSTSDILTKVLYTGTYYHLWFLYLLIWLYLLTPVLRLAVKKFDRKKILLLISICFALNFVSQVYSIVWELAFGGWVGFYLLGIVVKDVKVKWRWALIFCVLAGILTSIVGVYLIAANIISKYTISLNNSLSFNLIIASVALFLLLIAVPPNKVNSRHTAVNRLVHWISQNTLPIYLMHVAVLEGLELILLHLFVSINTTNPVIGVPLLALATFALTAAIVYALKKIPYIKRLIG